jgi:hypothetical protein
MALAFSQSQLVHGAPSLPGGWGSVALVAANVFVIVPETNGVSLEETGGTKRDQVTQKMASRETSRAV